MRASPLVWAGGEHTSSCWTLSEGLVLEMCRTCSGLLLTSELLSKVVVKVSSSCSSPWAGITHRSTVLQVCSCAWT